MTVTIGKQAIASLRWLAMANFAGQLITWATTILVIRILTPQDYGLMAMAMVFIGLLGLLNEMGMGAALVQREQLEQHTVEQTFGLLIVFNSAAYLFLFIGAPWIAEFFNEPRLTTIIRVAGLQFPLLSLAIVPESILRRRMDYRRQSLVAFSGMVTGALFTLGFALYGWGVWALVLGNLATNVVRTVGVNWVARYRCRPRFSLTGMRQVITFGGFVTLDQVLWFIYTQIDIFIIGKLMGKEPLGIYSVAKHLASMPMHKISALLNDVGFAAFSRIQNERELVAAHLYKAARLLSFFAFPVFFGISSVAPELVTVLLGEQWLATIFPLQMISLVTPLRMLHHLLTPALLGLGKPQIGVLNLLIGCALMTVAFLVGAHWEIAGVSLAWAVAYPIQFGVVLRIALPALGVRLVDYFMTMRSAAIASTVMYIVIAVTREAVAASLTPLINLIVLTTLGVMTYSSLMFLMQRRSYQDMLILFRR